MGTIWRTVRATPAWLTAVMTLVAGIPQLRCGCPGVDVKPAPSAPASQPAGCCCCSAIHEDSSEAASPSDENEESCCCHRSQKRIADSQTEPPADLQKPHCVKELQRTDAVAPTPTEKSDHQQQAGAQLSRTVPVCFPVHPPRPRIWGLHLLPPPTDLITLLQHLTI
jgi:hypothetical protein